MTPLPLLLVVVVAARSYSFDQPDISSNYLYDLEAEEVPDNEANFEGLEEGEDDSDLGYILPPRKKLDPSFSASTAPEQLFQNSQRIEQEARRVVKRSREKTVKQLIRLCRNTEGDEADLAHLQGMLGRLRSKAEYMKRLGPAILEQKRSRLMMKKAKVPNMKRSSMVKLKRMLADCLMEKNILEGRSGGGRKPATQFLRFGRG